MKHFLKSGVLNRIIFAVLIQYNICLAQKPVQSNFFVNSGNENHFSYQISEIQEQDDLTLKLMMGYQGWFLCKGDGSDPNDWRHWFQSTSMPTAAQLHIDMWPAMDEYLKSYATSMTYNDGSAARLFSSHDSSTTDLHFKWMKDYNIYGIYLQRFLNEAVNDIRFFNARNNVLKNVLNASQKYERHFAVMYDLSGTPDDGQLFDKLINDWEYLVDTYNITDNPYYVKQSNLPVLAIWGIGFPDRGLNPETFMSILDYFHSTADSQYRAFIVGGVPGFWRTLNGDAASDSGWLDVYHSLDMISPWTVGRYYSNQGADDWKAQRIIPDLADCDSNGVEYMPVIWPGFSWYNMHDGSTPFNEIPRNGGNFYWHQAYNAISSGARFLYVAMFDEVDEGTAMFKLTPFKEGAPVEGSFVTLDNDGFHLPDDWYLQLASETQKMLEGSVSLTSEIPVTSPIVPVTGVTLDTSIIFLNEGEYRELIPTVSPADATFDSVFWESGDTSVAKVDSRGLIKAVKKGYATIIVKTLDGGKTASCVINVISIPSSVVQNGTEQTLRISPVPATDHIFLDYDLKNPSVIDINMYSTNGSLLKSLHSNSEYGSQSLRLDISGLQSGLYILSFLTKDFSAVKKLIVQ